MTRRWSRVVKHRGFIENELPTRQSMGNCVISSSVWLWITLYCVYDDHSWPEGGQKWSNTGSFLHRVIFTKSKSEIDFGVTWWPLNENMGYEFREIDYDLYNMHHKSPPTYFRSTSGFAFILLNLYLCISFDPKIVPEDWFFRQEWFSHFRSPTTGLDGKGWKRRSKMAT